MKPKDISCTVAGCGGMTDPRKGIVLRNGDLGRPASAVACSRCSALYWVTDGLGVVVSGTSERVCWVV